MKPACQNCLYFRVKDGIANCSHPKALEYWETYYHDGNFGFPIIHFIRCFNLLCGPSARFFLPFEPPPPITKKFLWWKWNVSRDPRIIKTKPWKLKLV